MANFQVNLLFKADTTAAVNNVQQLGQLLSNISTKTQIGIDNGSLSQAVTSAQQLSIHLQNAINQDTGKLNLNKLNSSLKSAGTDLQTLTTNLQAAGPAGQQAFIKIATAVASAETPMIRVNQRLKDFGVTLVNTVKWQVASTAIHGISGMLSSAVGHAEDLNQALNDIRIVTGYSADSMSKFAIEASSAAKELSTTTTEYAKAALIFYQQGLSGDDVTKRADVVVKLAQVTRQSAEQVSSQMTAIWNNFDDGTKTLEYYADALTKLGAATAASTDEISDGLEKFAAIAETVGLSYEYAAAAVATVIDKTRQSADVVGTAFKTIFARMQGLSLGDTLEDGVDLNKYSQALEKVGIDVLTVDGELRDMDDILDDLGEKWQGFGKETQVALAQTVAGVRQYNQMISLMDNWGSVKKNIELASDATGELTKQQQIWSESYEAASNRVKQAQNDLYEQFIDDESIVKLNDIFAQLINSVGNVIESMGGIGPMVLMIAGLFSRQLFPLLQTGFIALKNNFSVLIGSAAKEVAFMQSAMKVQMSDALKSAGFSNSVKQQIELSKGLIDAKQRLTEASKNMSAAELEEAQGRMRVYEAMIAETQQSLERQGQLEKEIELERQKLTSGANKRVLVEQSARNSFQQNHTDIEDDQLDSLMEDARNMRTGTVKQEIAKRTNLAQNRAALQTQLEDVQTDPGLAEEERAKKVKELTAQIQDLNKADDGQIERYQQILELQNKMSSERKRDGKDISAGTISTDIDYLDSSNDGRRMVESTVQGLTASDGKTSTGAVTADGGIQVEASIGNLEALYQKMGEYSAQATTLKTMQSDLSQVFDQSSNSIIGNQDAIVASANAMSGYETATQTVTTAQQEYEDAVREVVQAQEAVDKSGKKDQQATERLAKAKTQLKSKEMELAKAQAEQKNALEQGSKSGQNYVKALLSMKSTLTEAAQAAGFSETEIDELNKSFNKLTDQKTAAEGLQEIINWMSRFEKSSNEAVTGIDNVATAIRDKLVASGFNAAQINAFIDKMVELGKLSPEIANQLRITGDAGGSIGPKMMTSSQMAVAGLTSIAAAAGKISMAVSGINALINAFKKGNTPLETFSGIITGLSMLIPAIVGVITLYNGVLQVNAEKTKDTTKATLMKMAADGQLSLSTGALTVVLWAQAAAQAVVNALTGDYGGLIIAVAAAATIAALAIGSQAAADDKLVNSQKMAVAGAKEQANQTNDLVTAWQAQTTAMDTLIQKYRELKAAEDDYKGVTTEIQESIPEMIKTYRDMADALDLPEEQRQRAMELIQLMSAAGSVGDIEAIDQYQNELDSMFATASKTQYENAARDAMYDVVEIMEENGDTAVKTFDGNTHIARDVWGAATQSGTYYYEDGSLVQVQNANGTRSIAASNEENAAVAVLQKHGIYEGAHGAEYDGATVGLDMSSPEAFLADYEATQAALAEMRYILGDQLDDSDVYNEVNSMMAGTEDAYNEMVELQKSAEQYGFVDKKSQMAAEGKDISDIQSYEDYVKYRDELLSGYEEGSSEYQSGLDWLQAHTVTAPYQEYDNKINWLKEATGKDYTDFVTGLDPEDQELFLQIDFNKHQSEAAINAELERLQSVADSKKIETKISQITVAQDTLKENGMTSEDWTKIQNETLAWGEDGIIGFNEFLNMTYEQQSQYLENQLAGQQAALAPTKQETLSALQERLTDPNLPQDEKAAIQENIDALEQELAITQKIAEEKYYADQKSSIEEQGIDYDEYKEYAEQINSMDGVAKMHAGTAEKIALAEKLQGKAVEDLVENYSDYANLLKKASLNPQIKGTEQYSKAITVLRKDLTNLTGASEDIFTEEFLNSEEAQKALADVANGVDGAVEKFKALAVTEELKQIAIKADLEIDEETFTTLYDELAALNNEDIEIGTKINDSEALNGLYNLMTQADMSVGQIQEMFNNLGWEPEIEYEVAEATTAAEMRAEGRQEYAVMNPDGSMSIHSVPIEGELAQGADQKVYIPKIVPANKKGGGFTKIDPPGTTSSSKPSGGGGGGGSKPTLKNDQSKERYHTLQNQLEDLKSEYDDISQAADRAFGKDKLKLMDDQLKKTDEMIEKQEEYLAAISADLPKDKAIMEAYYSDLIDGPAIEFDENGNISNFDAIQDAMYATYNANAENMSAEDWEAFEEKYGKLEEYIAQYEETYDLLREEEKAYQDLINQRMDEQLAIIQYQVDLKVDVADDALEVLEFQLSRLEDNAFSAAEAIALMGDQTELLMDKVAANTRGIQDILGQQLSSSELERFVAGDASVLEGKEFTQDQVDALRNYRSELLSLNQDLLQVREDVQSKVMDTFDAWNEKLQKGIDKFDHYSSVLTSYKNIVDLVGKSYLGVDNELLKSMNDAMIENSINKVGATRAAYEALLESQANAQAQYEAAVASGNENDIKFWADTLETIGEEVDAAQENMMAAWEESLQLAAEEFQRQVDVALEEFNTALTGFASMEEFRENFDFAKEVEEEYVPAYEKIYELSKLNRDINKTLNDDRVIKGKEKLLELQAKINQYQQDGVEMSEYEIANLQREYDLRMAEIALEEARNAKDTVRMSKDNEGNWSYVYTTNTEAVDTAQQEYEDALFAMQQANDEYLDEMSNLILDATQRMNEEIAALRLEDFANQQEYDAAVQAITDKYMGRIKYGQEQMQLAINNNADLYQNDWTAYSEATGYKIATDEEYVDSFNETILGKLLNSESQVVNVYDMINDQIGGLLEATSGAYADWSGQVDAANQAAGTSTDNFAEDMNNAINGPGGISESSGDAADSVYDMAEDMIEDFDRVAQAVSDWQRSYSNDIDTIIEKNLDAIEVCNALLSVLSDVQDVDLSNLTPTYDPYGKTYDNTTNSKDKDEEVVVVPVEQRGGNNNNSSGGGGIGRRAGIDSLSWREESSWREPSSVLHFASGGYTGEWGDDGRLAVLHQKELVLNAEDTTNMFKALNLTRQILDTIDLNAQYASGGLGQVMASSIRDAITQTLEQHVTIEADFPSVTDHNEIEIAMKNLINTASQFAHRK